MIKIGVTRCGDGIVDAVLHSFVLAKVWLVQMRVVLAVILSSLFGATPPVHAQAQTAGEITGQLLDPSRAAIPNAAVTATNRATGAVRKAQTDSQGHYALTNLRVGTY